MTDEQRIQEIRARVEHTRNFEPDYSYVAANAYEYYCADVPWLVEQYAAKDAENRRLAAAVENMTTARNVYMNILKETEARVGALENAAPVGYMDLTAAIRRCNAVGRDRDREKARADAAEKRAKSLERTLRRFTECRTCKHYGKSRDTEPCTMCYGDNDLYVYDEHRFAVPDAAGGAE